MEACELGFLSFMACASSALVRHHASPVAHFFEGRLFLQSLAIGLTMGITIVGIVYSPLGKRSGAQINPAVTFTFFRLGRIGAADAFFYILFQSAHPEYESRYQQGPIPLGRSRASKHWLADSRSRRPGSFCLEWG